MRLALAVLLVAFTSGAVCAQAVPGDASSGRAEVERATIALDVIVDGVRAGRPLTADDFQVAEDGQPLPIESVRLVQPSSPAAALPAAITDENEEAAAAAAGRLVAVFVDEYHLRDAPAFEATRAALAAFVRGGLGPNDLVAVLKPLDSLLSIRLTKDRESAARIVEQAVPRQGDYTARSAFEQNFIAGAPARIDAARSQIALSSLSALTSHLGRFDAGRKTLIVMSDGFAPATAAARGGQFLPGFDSIVRLANRERVAIYVLQPSRAAGGPARAATDAEPAGSNPLAALADRTTGFVMVGGDAAAAGLSRISREAGSYYLLTLAPVSRPADGRFRNVTVSVRRPGASIRARAGYAVRRRAPAAPRRPGLMAGLNVPRHVSPLIRTWFGQSADDGGTRVAFVWEPAPSVPGAARQSATPARLTMSVTTLDGTPVFSGASVPSGRQLVPGVGDPAELSFRAQPGPLLVRMEVLDAGGGVLDRDVRDLTVQTFAAPLAFGSPAIFRARTFPALRAIADGTAASAPVAARRFSRAEHLLVRMPVEDAGNRTAVVTATLQSRFGATLRQLDVIRRDRSTADVQLPLAGLASGGYALAFEARDGDASARTTVDFVVIP